MRDESDEALCKTMKGCKPTLLFLSGASLVAQNAIAALGSRRSGFHLVAMNSSATEPSLFSFDEVFIVPEVLDATTAFSQAFERVVQMTSPDLVIPGRDDDDVRRVEDRLGGVLRLRG